LSCRPQDKKALFSFSFLYPSVSAPNIFSQERKKTLMRKLETKKLAAAVTALALCAGVLTGCGSAASGTASSASTADSAASSEVSSEEADEVAAKNVADLIDAIYVQERNDDTDAQCEAAKAAWDALTDKQKEMVEGENADPDYFGRDTGDASKDDARNEDSIGENELLVVSFGTSFNDSRVADIKGIEDALQEAYPDWSVRRAFTAQIIINHVQARDGEKIDNMQQALDRAVANGVKNLVVQPTHLMHGAEYDEMNEMLDQYRDKFETIAVAEPLLGEVGSDATVINEDKEAVAKAITAAAVKDAGFDSLDAAAAEKTAFVFMGHGTSHTAKVSYSQMQTTMQTLGYDNVFIGTVEGEPEETACENVIEAVKASGYTKVVLRPLMVVAGDHANNDMAGSDDDSWLSMFNASGAFESVDCQIAGLGEIADIQQLYIAHTKAAIDSLNG
jgi:sirohydrochlorin cobaltochelatase